MKRIAALAAVVLALTLTGAGHGAATGYSLTPQNQPVHWGQDLTLIGVYQKVDAKQWPPRIYNPSLAVSCTSADGVAWRGVSWRTNGKSINLGDGWRQSDFPVGSPLGSGAGSCTAWLEFTDSVGDTMILVSVTFAIS